MKTTITRTLDSQSMIVWKVIRKNNIGLDLSLWSLSQPSEQENQENQRASQDCHRKGQNISNVGTICFGILQLHIFWFDVVTCETIFIPFAQIGKNAWGVLAVKIYVAEHSVCTISWHVIDLLRKRAGKFLEGTTTQVCCVLWPFTFARDDGIILVLKVDWTICR